MSKIYRLLFLVACVCLLAGCEKEIDFKYHEIPPIPVIEGVLSESGIKVGIKLTTPMNEPMDSTRLTDAQVTITDIYSGLTTSLIPDAEGYYVSPIEGIIGREYRLTVEREDITYSMSTEMLPPVVIESAEFEWISMPYDDVAVLQVRYTDNPLAVGECYWVKVYRNGELYLWQEQSDRTADNGIMTFIAMTSRKDTEEEDDDDVLLDGDIVTIEILPINREMHDYLEALANNSNGPQLFTTTPSPSLCLGYFIATSPVSTSLIFHR